MLVLILPMLGCAGQDKTGGEAFFDGLFAADITARRPLPQSDSGPPDEGPPPPQIYPGSAGGPNGSAAYMDTQATTARVGRVGGGDTYDLNFENADISAVVKALMGDVLGYPYSVDPRVSGSISLSSGRPLPKSDVLPMLEAALKVANAAVVKDGPLYRVVPSSEAIGAGTTDRGGRGRIEPGYGISVLPLKYVSAQAVIRVIESFAARPGAVRIDPQRNLIIIQGTSTERSSALEAALALDVDWLRNQSVGIYPLRNASPEAVITELEGIMASGEGGTGQNMVKFMPVSRINAVLAVAKTREQIAQVQAWITRLDQSDTSNTGLRVYRVRFGSAKIIAGLLNEVFTGRASTAGTSDLAQLTPGATAQSASTSSQSSTSSSSDDDDDDDSSSSSSGFSSGSTQQQGSSRDRAPGQANGTAAAGAGGPAPFPNVRISADIANNALLIYATREQFKAIERAVRELDRAPLQVAIDTIIAEVTLSDNLQYGVQFFVSSAAMGLGKNKGSIGYGETKKLERMIPGFNLLLGPNQDPRLIIDALKNLTQVKVLSSPSLVVLDNQPATLQVGDQVPIATSSAQSNQSADAPTVNTIDFRNTGVILSVTPRVNANGVVALDVEQEISHVVNQGTGTTLTPTISQRKVKSSIAVASGQTVLLGGLISERHETTRQGLPILSDLKGIGELFGSTSKSVSRTELILFIRPQIIRDGVDAQLVAEELRSKVFLLSGGTRAKP
jgi:general secretion pathway protein D